MALSSDYIRTSLQNLYGNTITGADIRAWCNLNDANYQTVTKKLDLLFARLDDLESRRGENTEAEILLFVIGYTNHTSHYR